MKIGIIGLGSIGTRHYNNFKSLKCDVAGYDPERGGDGTGLFGCDGMVIASPSALHLTHIKDYNCPLLVEKPVVMYQEELDELPAYIDRIKMVGYNLRFHGCVSKAKELMGQGIVGRPLWARFICAQFNDRQAYRRDGVVLNWSHEIDLALHLLGPATVINSVVERGEAYANINLRHANSECDTNIHLDYITRPERRGFTIIGEIGSITADLVARQIFVKNNDGNITQSYAFKDSFDMNYLTEAATFLRIIARLYTIFHYCTAEEAIEVVKICIAAKEMASV